MITTCSLPPMLTIAVAEVDMVLVSVAAGADASPGSSTSYKRPSASAHVRRALPASSSASVNGCPGDAQQFSAR